MPNYRPSDLSIPEFHQILLGTISPRPIAFASTVDKDGNVNLSPFSFFNVFGSSPGILVFSPTNSVKTGAKKNTLENVLEVPEVTINIVNYAMVEQMSLASTAYPKGVDEFVKSGFTPIPSELVKPPRVKEAPASYECKVLEVKSFGDHGGAANLIICEVQMVHLADDIFTDGKIDPQKIDTVSRMGGDWYCRAKGDAVFEVEKPLSKLGIGVDSIPANIRNSNILTGNHLGKLGNVEALPTEEEVDSFANEPEVSAILQAELSADDIQTELHKLAAQHLDNGDSEAAWKVLLQY